MFLNLKIKFLNVGTNSKSFFLKSKYNFFISFISLNINKIYIVKILQNKFFNFVKILLNIKNKTFYFKIFGKMIYFPNFYCFIKILKDKNIFLKKKNKKKIFFLFYNNILKNKISKLIYKNLYINYYNTKFVNHNDLFKDNILFYGNILTSVIDFYNYNYYKNKIDFDIIKNEISYNYKIIKYTIFENIFYNFKKKKYSIINFFISRIKKLKQNKKNKNYNSYLKKDFYD